MSDRTKLRFVMVEFDGDGADMQAVLSRLNGAALAAPEEKSPQPMAIEHHPPPIAVGIARAKTKKSKVGKLRKAAKGRPLADDPEEMSPSDFDSLAFSLGVYLRDNGPKRIDAIAREFPDFDQEQLRHVLTQSPWFEKSGTCFTLSSDGNVHFRQRGDD